MPSAFESEVYACCRRIPKGRVTTYGEIARAINSKRATPHVSKEMNTLKKKKNTTLLLARAVGNALNKNPYAPNVPCHRVVRSDGCAGGFAFGFSAKERLLRKEGVIIRKGIVQNFSSILITCEEIQRATLNSASYHE